MPPGDHADPAGAQVSEAYLDQAARPVALRPRGEVPADRRGVPRARPRSAGRRVQRAAEPYHAAGDGIPGDDGEAVQAGERVRLLPDQPPAAPRAVGLVARRVAEPGDRVQRSRGQAEGRDSREPPRPGRHVGRRPVRRDAERDDLAAQRRGHGPGHRGRQGARRPARAEPDCRPGTASRTRPGWPGRCPAGRSGLRRSAGAGRDQDRDDRDPRLPGAPPGGRAHLGNRYQTYPRAPSMYTIVTVDRDE